MFRLRKKSICSLQNEHCFQRRISTTHFPSAHLDATLFLSLPRFNSSSCHLIMAHWWARTVNTRSFQTRDVEGHSFSHLVLPPAAQQEMFSASLFLPLHSSLHLSWVTKAEENLFVDKARALTIPDASKSSLSLFAPGRLKCGPLPCFDMGSEYRGGPSGNRSRLFGLQAFRETDVSLKWSDEQRPHLGWRI